MNIPLLYVATISAAVMTMSLVLILQPDAGTHVSSVEPDVPAHSPYSAANIDSPEIPELISHTNNLFALDFHRLVYPEAAGSDKNIFFSPLGIYTAFSMLYEGARGSTEYELDGVFLFDPDESSRLANTAKMIADINADDEHATLKLANSLWLKKDFDPYDSYVQTIRDTYLASIERVDFLGDGVDRINAWAAEKTHGKIPKVLSPADVTADTAAALLNAIYFKGMWLTQFDKEDTHTSTFYSGEREISAEFMSMESKLDYYVTRHDIKVLRLPYSGDRLSMLLLLPANPGEIEYLQDNLSAQALQNWGKKLVTHDKVVVKIPKFETRTNYNLIPTLYNLGLQDIFSASEADLTGIAEGPPRLYVETATHDAYVKVNEEGTEAAAATTAILTLEELAPPPPSFIADRPFMFFIMDDESGTVLFMGSILDPTA